MKLSRISVAALLALGVCAGTLQLAQAQQATGWEDISEGGAAKARLFFPSPPDGGMIISCDPADRSISVLMKFEAGRLPAGALSVRTATGELVVPGPNLSGDGSGKFHQGAATKGAPEHAALLKFMDAVAEPQNRLKILNFTFSAADSTGSLARVRKACT